MSATSTADEIHEVEITPGPSTLPMYTYYHPHFGQLSFREAFVYLRSPPDGGFAWLILAFSFLASASVDGMLLCIGHLLPYIAEEMSLTDGKSVIISSAQYGLYFLIGPFASAALNKLGFRIVGVAGALISFSGLIAGSFSKKYSLLICCFGLLDTEEKQTPPLTSTLIDLETDKQIFIFLRLPPDGGWSWLVLISSLITLTCVDGILLCIGHLLPEIRSDIHLSETGVVVISSIQNGIYYLSGPVVSAAMNKFGFRRVGCAGGILATFGMFGGAWSHSYAALLCFFGFLVGIGFGMIYASSQIVVGYYFEKYRAIATGISCSGTGFGTLVFSRLNQYLVRSLGWRHTVQVHGFFCILIAFLCIVFRPVPRTDINKLIDGAEESGESIELETTIYSVHDMESSAPAPGRRHHGRFEKRKKKKKFLIKLSPCCYKEKPPPQRRGVSVGPLYREDIFYAGSITQLPQYKDAEVVPSTRDMGSTLPQMQSINYALSTIKTPTEQKKDQKKRCQIPPAITDAFKLLLDVNILKIFNFEVVLLSSFCYILGNNIPYIYMTRRAQIPSEYANWLLPTTGILNIIFRISSGFLAFKMSKINPAYLVAGSLIFGGLICLISAEFGQDKIWFQFFYSFGFSIGVSIMASLRTVILVNILGLSRLTNAFGLSSLAMGIGTFLGTTVAGILVDITGDYDASFQFCGWALLLAGILMGYIPYLQIVYTQI